MPRLGKQLVHDVNPTKTYTNAYLQTRISKKGENRTERYEGLSLKFQKTADGADMPVGRKNRVRKDQVRRRRGERQLQRGGVLAGHPSRTNSPGKLLDLGMCNDRFLGLGLEAIV